MKIRCLFIFALSYLYRSAFAFEPFVVQEIQIEGLQRVSEGTVLNYLPLQIGDRLEPSETSALIRALYETKFFQDIHLSQSGNALIIKVVESPAIGKIDVSGNKDLSKENLLSTLKEVGIAVGAMFDLSILEQVRNELERMYFSHGKYGVNIETQVENLPNNRVNIVIKIEEGLEARIKEINIVGNQKFSNHTLLKKLSLAPSSAFSWVTRSDQYDKQKLNADLETIRTFYLDRGYLDFQITSTQVSITPDKRDIYITINVQEGDVYHVSGFSVLGNTVLPEKDLLDLVNIKQGQVFSRREVADIVKHIMDKLGEAGYSFAKVNPVPELDANTHQVAINFFVEPGNKITVRRIDFEGNTKTKDVVLRRDMIQPESAPINTKQVEGSRDRLNRTGFFDKVEVETKPVPGIPDQVDLLYSVTETASAGQLGGGVGYSDVDGILFNVNVSNRNFLGTGNSLDFSFNRSKAYTTYNVGYYEPYFNLDGVGFGMNFYYSQTELSEISNVTSYSTNAIGGNFNFSYPITEFARINYGLGAQSTELEFDDRIQQSLEMKNFEGEYGRHHNDATAVLGVSYNNLDRYLFPEDGVSQSLNGTATIPGSDLLYYRLTYHGNYYKGLGKGYVFTLAANLGYGNGYAKTNTMPFYKHFFAGGPHSVRGYRESSLGPKDTLGNPFGGNALASGTVGIVLPNFIKETNAVRAQIFLDGGQVYDFKRKYKLDSPFEKRNPNEIKYSAGISLTWMSPMAPLVLTLAAPLNANDSDNRKYFSFTFGTVF